MTTPFPFPLGLATAPSVILPLAQVRDKLEKIFQNAPTDPTQDFSTQVYVVGPVCPLSPPRPPEGSNSVASGQLDTFRWLSCKHAVCLELGSHGI